jgi:signal transduction histidine kinase
MMPHSLIRDIRKKDISKFHIQLSLAILLMLTVSLVFVAFNIEGIVYEGCVTVSVLLHYFTLVAVMWMGAEALLMFQKLVIVFVTITTKYIVTVSVICWCKYSRLISLSSEKSDTCFVALFNSFLCSRSHYSSPDTYDY